MTQEDKELLLKDLCGRLSYGVIVDYKEDEYDFHHWKISTLHAPSYSQSGSLINTDSDGWIEYNEYKGCGMSSGSRPLDIEKNLPFLRSMSSMSKEEEKEWQYYKNAIAESCDESLEERISELHDWFNANHFDYRGLIPKGLAIEVTKENNPYEKINL